MTEKSGEAFPLLISPNLCRSFQLKSQLSSVLLHATPHEAVGHVVRVGPKALELSHRSRDTGFRSISFTSGEENRVRLTHGDADVVLSELTFTKWM